MTKRERREQSEWRRCIYCGRYMSMKDFEEGRAKTEYEIYYQPYSPDMTEESITGFHLACKEKQCSAV